MDGIKLYTPEHWKDYELIDSGDGEKLERFGSVILSRPEPQALWDKELSENEWRKEYHVRFVQRGSHSGEWQRNKPCDDRWQIGYKHGGLNIKFNLSLTSFKHVGIFPEQALNWDYIYAHCKKLVEPQPRVLNLFAYTGGASLAACAGGADVTHVDSVKQVITWSKENMEASGLDNIRWVVEDALKFVKREVKRGKKYNGIILDPPAYGIGANGERWKLDELINEMLLEIKELLDEQHFLVLNMYSLGMSALITENMIRSVFHPSQIDSGEVYLGSRTGQKLPLGILARFTNIE
jgi:23S rRNA (cytosine1962-C5)-methyltransferase